MLLNEQLGRLAALYPEAGHNGKTLRIVAEEWAALLHAEEASERELMDALAVVKRRCRFFPKTADLKEALDWVREHPPRIPESRRLPEADSRPMSEKAKRAAEIIAAQLTKRITPQEASRQIAALGLR